MEYNTIKNVNLKGKTILLRVDLNSEIKNGKVVLSDRIIKHAETIKFLKNKKAKVVVLAHQGRKDERDFLSLKQHCKLLNKFVKIGFVDDIIGAKAVSEIKNLREGNAILLENVRFLKEEDDLNLKNKFVKTLSEILDYYINDALSICHREQASIVSFPKIIPGFIGPVLEEELENIKKIKIENSLLILGGAKIENNLISLSKRGSEVLPGGLFAPLVSISRGINLGEENKILKNEIKFSKVIKGNKKIISPLDFAVEINGKREEFNISEFPKNYKILDIGKKTIEEYKKIISKSKNIFMRGTVGYCEDDKFSLGTYEILKAIKNSSARTFVAGGNTLIAIKRFGMNKKDFDYISLSGGALVEYLIGGKLPGLEVLKKVKNV